MLQSSSTLTHSFSLFLCSVILRLLHLFARHHTHAQAHNHKYILWNKSNKTKWFQPFESLVNMEYHITNVIVCNINLFYYVLVVSPHSLFLFLSLTFSLFHILGFLFVCSYISFSSSHSIFLIFLVNFSWLPHNKWNAFDRYNRPRSGRLSTQNRNIVWI